MIDRRQFLALGGAACAGIAAVPLLARAVPAPAASGQRRAFRPAHGRTFPDVQHLQVPAGGRGPGAGRARRAVAGPAGPGAGGGPARPFAGERAPCRQGPGRARPVPGDPDHQRQRRGQPAAAAGRRAGRAHRLPARAGRCGHPGGALRAGRQPLRGGRSARHHQPGGDGRQPAALRAWRCAGAGRAPATGRLADRQRDRRRAAARGAAAGLAGGRQDRQQRPRHQQQGSTLDDAGRDGILRRVGERAAAHLG